MTLALGGLVDVRRNMLSITRHFFDYITTILGLSVTDTSGT